MQKKLGARGRRKGAPGGGGGCGIKGDPRVQGRRPTEAGRQPRLDQRAASTRAWASLGGGGVSTTP
jgi:hypothetical protein